MQHSEWKKTANISTREPEPQGPESIASAPEDERKNMAKLDKLMSDIGKYVQSDSFDGLRDINELRAQMPGLQQDAQSNPREVLLKTLRLVASHGVGLNGELEKRVDDACRTFEIPITQEIAGHTYVSREGLSPQEYGRRMARIFEAISNPDANRMNSISYGSSDMSGKDMAIAIASFSSTLLGGKDIQNINQFITESKHDISPVYDSLARLLADPSLVEQLNQAFEEKNGEQIEKLQDKIEEKVDRALIALAGPGQELSWQRISTYIFETDANKDGRLDSNETQAGLKKLLGE